MNFWNNINSNYESMNLIIAIASFFLILATWRLARMRRDDSVRLETVILNGRQWAMVCFFSIGQTLGASLEFMDIHFSLGFSRLLLSIMMCFSYLILFEAGRLFFKKHLKPWIYLFLLPPLVYYAFYADEATIFDFIAHGIVPWISCLLFAIAIIIRLKNLNLMCPQLRGTAIGFLLHGTCLLTLGFEQFAIVLNFDTPQSIISNYHFTLIITNLILYIGFTALIADHFGYVRDRFLNIAIKNRRAYIRRAILFITVIALSVGAIFSDITAGHTRFKVINTISQTAQNAMLRFKEHQSVDQFTQKEIPFLESTLPGVKSIHIFSQNTYNEWELKDKTMNKLVPKDWNERLNAIAESKIPSIEVLPRYGHITETLFVTPLTTAHSDKIKNLLLFHLSESYISSQENSARLKILLGTLLLSGFIILFWLLYSLGEDRRILVNNNAQQFNQLFRQSQSVAILVEPATGIIVDANMCADTFFGYGTGGLRHKNVTELHLIPIHPENEKTFKTDTQNLILAHEGHFLLMPPNQAPRHVKLRAWSINFLGEDLTYCTLTDITPYVTEGKKLKEKVTQLEELFESIPFPAYLKNNEDQYIMVNELFAHLGGKHRNQLIGKQSNDVWTQTLNPNPSVLDAMLRKEPERKMRSDKIMYESNTVHHAFYIQRRLITWDGLPHCIFGIVVPESTLNKTQNMEKING